MSESIGKGTITANELTSLSIKNTTYQKEIENLRISLKLNETKYKEDMTESDRRFKEASRKLKETEAELVNQVRLQESSQFAYASQNEELNRSFMTLQQNLREAQSQVKDLSVQKSFLAAELEETKMLFQRSQAALICKTETRNHDEHVSIKDNKVDYVQLCRNSIPSIRRVSTNHHCLPVNHSSTGDDKQFQYVQQDQDSSKRQPDITINQKTMKKSNQDVNQTTRKSFTKKESKQIRSNNPDTETIMYTVPSIIHRDNNPEQSMVTSPSISIATMMTWNDSPTKEVIREDDRELSDQKMSQEVTISHSVQNQEVSSDKQLGQKVSKQLEENDKREGDVVDVEHRTSFIYDLSDFETESNAHIMKTKQINPSSPSVTNHLGQEEQDKSVGNVEHHTSNIYDMSDFETESITDIIITKQLISSSSSTHCSGKERIKRVEEQNKGRENKPDDEHQSSTVYDISDFDTESNADIIERKQSKPLSSLSPTISSPHQILQPDLKINSNSIKHDEIGQSQIHMNIDDNDSSIASKDVSSSNTSFKSSSQCESSSLAGIKVYSYKNNNQQSDWW